MRNRRPPRAMAALIVPLGGATLGRASVASGPKPTAYIDITCRTRAYGEKTLGHNVSAAQDLRGDFVAVLKDDPVFGEYTFLPSRATNMDLRMTLALTSEENAHIVGFILSGITLSILPATATKKYCLTARVFAPVQGEQAKYEVTDSMRTWIQLFLLPFSASRSPAKVEKQLRENMLRTVLARMKTDGLL